MGLDMYLTKRIYIGSQYKHNKITGTINLKKNNKKIEINKNKINSIIEDVYYWRKSNAIHNFFVDNVQEGINNCQNYFVPYEKLKLLFKYIREDLKYLDNIKKIKKDSNNTEYYIFENVKIDKLKLKPLSGFFFGSTNIDNWFYHDLKNTLEKLEPIIDEYSEYYYRSS